VALDVGVCLQDGLQAYDGWVGGIGGGAELVDVVECSIWECGGTALVAEPVDAARAGAAARVFKALADPVRVRLLSLIGSRTGGEACVCELTGEFDVSNPTISHHLKGPARSRPRHLPTAGVVGVLPRGTCGPGRAVAAAGHRDHRRYRTRRGWGPVGEAEVRSVDGHG
jgi:hypothetical protein